MFCHRSDATGLSPAECWHDARHSVLKLDVRWAIINALDNNDKCILQRRACCVWMCFIWCYICSSVCFCYPSFTPFSITDTSVLRTFFDILLGILTWTYRVFHTEDAENASRDRPSGLISDYVTVKRTGRGRRRCLNNSFHLFKQLLATFFIKTLVVCQEAFTH